MSEAEDYAARMESIRMIRDSAAAVAAPGGELKRIRELRFTEAGFDPAMLAEMGALGWIGLRLPEEAGGAALGMAECCALAEELGSGLVPEPLLASMLSARLLAAAGAAAPLERVLAGEAYLPTAWQEAPDTLDVAGSPDGLRCFAPATRSAAGLLALRREEEGLVLHLVPASAQPVVVQALQDGGHVGALRPRFEDAERLGTVGEVVEAALDEAALATAAYLLGAMERCFATTLDYLRTRQQFGRAIGSFQALQHRAVDLKVQIALTRASVEAAAATLDAQPAAPLRRAAVSRAKARAAEAAMRVTREAVQLHGAIGYTDEYDIGLFLRKAMVLANDFGSAALHRRRFMASAPADEA